MFNILLDQLTSVSVHGQYTIKSTDKHIQKIVATFY